MDLINNCDLINKVLDYNTNLSYNLKCCIKETERESILYSKAHFLLNSYDDITYYQKLIKSLYVPFVCTPNPCTSNTIKNCIISIIDITQIKNCNSQIIITELI
jgi:hypothetical protein